jgi:hypothetical protein
VRSLPLCTPPFSLSVSLRARSRKQTPACSLLSPG